VVADAKSPLRRDGAVLIEGSTSRAVGDFDSLTAQHPQRG